MAARLCSSCKRMHTKSGSARSLLSFGDRECATILTQYPRTRAITQPTVTVGVRDVDVQKRTSPTPNVD